MQKAFIFWAISVQFLVGIECGTVSTSGYCVSKECILAAGDILSAINVSMDPCDDFYEFACGNWKKDHSLPFDGSVYDPFVETRDKVFVILRDELIKDEVPTSKAVQDAKLFFSTCMQENVEVETLKADLNILKGWPIVAGSSWDPQSFDFSDILMTVKYLVEVPVLFNIYVLANEKNSSIYALHIDQVELGGLSPIFLLLPDNHSEIIQSYKTFISQAAYTLGATNSKTVDADVESIVNFDTQIANLIVPSEETFNFSKMYNKMSIDQLQETAGTFLNWKALFGLLMNNTELNGTEELVVIAVDYLKNLDALLKKTDNRTIANYLLWRYVQYHSWHVGGELAHLYINLSKVKQGIKEAGPRWKTCVGILNEFMMFAMGRLYVERNFDENGKKKAAELVTFIRKFFIDHINSLEWLGDGGTRLHAIEKAENILEMVGYPDWIYNDTVLDQAYESFYIGNNSHYDNMKQVIFAMVADGFSLIDMPVDRNSWIATPSLVNAFYSHEGNTITFPAAILQSPFFDAGRAMYLNFGAIGVVIGHETTHGFDNLGRQFDLNGNLNNWWDNSTLLKFNELSQCFVNEFDHFCPDELKSRSICVNGKNTLSENIADSGGLKTAFHAHRQWELHHEPDGQLPGLQSYTNDQLFFLSFAQLWCSKGTEQAYEINTLYDVHSPNKFRTNGPLSNSFEFVNAFQCVGKPMDRQKKCVLW